MTEESNKKSESRLSNSRKTGFAKTGFGKAKSKYTNTVSPTKELIEQMESRIHTFDVNLIWEWN